MKFTLTEAAAAIGGAARIAGTATAAAQIVTDTRSIARGDAFLALRGERFDGNAYAREALAQGAAYAIVSDAAALGERESGIVVDDTLRAYLALAAASRAALTVPVIAITGSTGKTTTKHLLVQLLERAGLRVAATPANENNEIGVSKLLVSRESGDDDVLVVEMGARHYGDIATLVDAARPTLGILTNVGEAHLEIMGSHERLAETKWGLFSRGAEAVLNRADAVSRERASRLAAHPRWFGVGDEPAAPATHTTVVRDATALADCDGAGERRYAIDVTLPGTHNQENLAAALAAAATIVPLERLAPLVASLVLPAGRYERHAVDGATVVFDAYNASASGTRATLLAFGEEPASRRIAVLGGMAELGADEAALHAEVGAAAADLPEAIVLAGGECGDEIASGARERGLDPARIVRYRQNAEAAAWLRANLRPGDAVLLKGSRRYRMEEILEALVAGAPQPCVR